MKQIGLGFCVLLALFCLAACEPEKLEGGGKLPEHGTELITNYVKDEIKDDSGGRITYIKDVTSTEPGELLWCVNVRYVNSQGVITAPILVSQRGEEWRLDRNPDQGVYEGYGCVWPKSAEQ